jgi:transposase InsO family protein
MSSENVQESPARAAGASDNGRETPARAAGASENDQETPASPARDGKKMNTNITTVTGRPRKPNDQGSVENVNKLIKRVIKNFEEAARQKGEEPNWTHMLGNVMA